MEKETQAATDAVIKREETPDESATEPSKEEENVEMSPADRECKQHDKSATGEPMKTEEDEEAAPVLMNGVGAKNEETSENDDNGLNNGEIDDKDGVEDKLNSFKENDESESYDPKQRSKASSSSDSVNDGASDSSVSQTTTKRSFFFNFGFYKSRGMPERNSLLFYPLPVGIIYSVSTFSLLTPVYLN